MHLTDLSVKDNQNGFKTLTTLKDIPSDSLILPFHYSRLLEKPDRYTIQWKEDKHLDPEPEALRYTNHSCDPNVFFDFELMQLVSLKKIKSGEELQFFYPATEWEMEETFSCQCGSQNCLGSIKGAKYLDEQTLKSYRLSEFIKSKR